MPDDFRIRPARAAEQSLIRSMIRHEHLDPLNVHWQNFIVAENAQGILGIAQIKPYPGGRELGSLVVVPERRRSGVGAALIRALLAREAGPLVLFCLSFREAYYAKFGFQRVGLRELPAAFKFKYALGWFLTRFFKHKLIVMARSMK
jgi:N-acetylglutamate synthase-like GNAT family acetyltransferase